MKKVILLLFATVCIGANAQTESTKVADNSLSKNELQLEMGDAMQSLRLIDKDMVGDGSPSFSLSYHNRVLKWLWLGASVSYRQESFTTSKSWTDGRLTEYENFGIEHSFAFVPSIRFSYYNKPNLTMYSGGQIGMCWIKGAMPEWSFEGKVNYIGMFGQLTLFGITYGKKFYLGGEIGMGNKGLFNFTAGYRF